MTRFKELLYTDFDGNSTTDIVLYKAFDDPRHLGRVPGLVELMNDSAAPEMERFIACMALTTWAEPAGYEAVMRAAADPEKTAWYDFSVDRKFSVDSTFSQLALAVENSCNLSDEKGTEEQRQQAFRALVRLADRQYFEDRLGELFDDEFLMVALDDIKDVIGRGVRSLASGEKQRFDLATQLVDLSGAVAMVDGRLAVELAMSVLDVSASPRTLNHAVDIVYRGEGPEVRQFAEYLTAVGDEEVRRQVREALNEA